MEKNFECTQCNYKTDKRGNYNRHLKTKKHLDIHRIEYCDLCDYNTNKKTNLIRHCKKYHSKPQKTENNDFYPQCVVKLIKKVTKEHSTR